MNTSKKYRKGLQNGLSCCDTTPPYYFGCIDGNHKQAGKNNVLQALPPKGLQTVETPTGIDDNKVNNKDELTIEEHTEGEKSKPQFSTNIDPYKDEYSLGELLSLNVTEIPFLWNKLIPRGSLVVLGGPSESGKSTLYTQLALAIVKGNQEFLGLKLNAIHSRVLIISTEDGPEAFSFRVIKQLNESKIGPKIQQNLVVIFSDENLENRISEILSQTRVDLVIIDAFSDFLDNS